MTDDISTVTHAAAQDDGDDDDPLQRAFDATPEELGRAAVDAADEAEAWKHLYSGLDEQQSEIYSMLVDRGILPPKTD